MRLSNFKILTFDCYGTLIDWESGMFEALKPLTSKLDLSRDQVLEAHARHESAQQVQTPAMVYSTLLAVVYKRLAEEWAFLPAGKMRKPMAIRSRTGRRFKDSVKSLSYLKKHFKLAILSNVDNASFAHSNKRLKVEFDAVYTAQDVGSYKPSSRNFDYMLEKLKSLGFERQHILHTAESLFHDHVPANKHGLASCWIYRRHDKQGFGATVNPGAIPRHDFKFNSLAELAEAHRKEHTL